MVLINDSNSQSVTIKNVQLNSSRAKFYADGDKGKEIPISQIEGKVIPPGQSYQINSCGREYDPHGTGGSYDLVDDSEQVIRHFDWDCPWDRSTNTWQVTGQDTDWQFYWSGENLQDGALGTITIKFYNTDRRTE